MSTTTVTKMMRPGPLSPFACHNTNPHEATQTPTVTTGRCVAATANSTTMYTRMNTGAHGQSVAPGAAKNSENTPTTKAIRQPISGRDQRNASGTAPATATTWTPNVPSCTLACAATIMITVNMSSSGVPNRRRSHGRRGGDDGSPAPTARTRRSRRMVRESTSPGYVPGGVGIGLPE